MPQSLAQIYVHVVFSTKERRPLLQNFGLRDETHCYLGKTSSNLSCPIVRVGGAADHVHLLCLLGRSITIADLVKELKRDCSQWLKTKSPELSDFYWQHGYGAFSVSPSHVDALVEYIDHQEEHHRTTSYQDEFRKLLTKYGVEWDERYVWD